MYFKHNTIDEVIKLLESYRDEAQAKIEAWKTVEIKKKKNGEEYSKIGQATVNASFGKYTPVEDVFHPYLTIMCKSCGRWIEDNVQAFYYVDELPVEERNRDVIYKESWSRATSPMTAEELRKTISEYIEKLEAHKNSLERQIANASVMFEKYRNAIANAEKELEEADKKLREKDWQTTSLYYAITSTR